MQRKLWVNQKNIISIRSTFFYCWCRRSYCYSGNFSKRKDQEIAAAKEAERQAAKTKYYEKVS
ncbi:hypothetical protein [Mycoplasmopsis arginini]|uniref:hypothetical protein n=1 Tax=Mycoplasmopsis arginini TaxID=2094 RepID=UPI0011B2694E|nr:hypothetical protein [Mycoplasmopsis arginini]